VSTGPFRIMKAVLLTVSTLALARLLAAAPLPAEVVSVEALRSPFCMVGESVKISVGKSLSVFEGDYDFKYVRRHDSAAMADEIPFQYAVFAPRSADSLEEITASTGARLHLGSIDFEPEEFIPMQDGDGASVQVAPEDARGVILVFKIPRRLLRQQCRLHITHYQSYYHYAGKTVAACLPLLPDFESLKNELLFSRSDFTVEFETVDAVRLHRLSVNQSVESDTPARICVHAVDRENIAVEVSELTGK
jgi:hypothetical protein